MSLVSLSLQGGVNKDDTTYSKSGRWIDTQWVRAFEKRIQKIGGWQKLLEDQVLGVGRSLLPWIDDDQNRRVAIGTHRRLYYYYAGTFVNITPIRATSTINNNPIATTSGSANVEITDTGHGAGQGDIVNLTGATAVGGITISGDYTIVSVSDADHYIITHSSAASSSATGGGASVVAAYEISVGLQNSVLAYGYGVGTYGTGTYGTLRTTSVILAARTWSLGVRGESLYACPRGGGIYKWSPGDTRATLLANAPTKNTAMFVTADGIVVAIGNDGAKRSVKWCDQDDDTDWSASIDDTAGDKSVVQASEMLAGATSEDQVSLLWSTNRAIRMQRITDDFIFAFRAFGADTGIIGPNAGIEHMSSFYWMGANDFLMSDGNQVIPIPNSEDIRRHVFGDINLTQSAKCFAGVNTDFSEIWFFYCSLGSTEVDRYVSVNVKEWAWFTGTITANPRTAWADNGVFEYPVAIDPDGSLYQHETGVNADGAAIEAYAKSAPFRDEQGRTIEILSVMPDIKDQVGVLNVAIYVRDDPQPVAETLEETLSFAANGAAQDPRAAGALVAFQFSSNEVDGNFRFGRPEFYARLTGSMGRRRGS